MKIRLARNQLFTLFSLRFALICGVITLIYLMVSMLLPNYRLIYSLPSSSMGFFEKVEFFILLFVGSFSSYSILENALTITTGILVGLNLALYLKSLRLVAKPSSHVSMSSQAFFGMAVGGCSSCGTSLISIMAGALGISILPFQIHLLQIFSILLLTFSFFYTLQKTGVCEIKR
jgi:hypothetical protein